MMPPVRFHCQTGRWCARFVLLCWPIAGCGADDGLAPSTVVADSAQADDSADSHEVGSGPGRSEVTPDTRPALDAGVAEDARWQDSLPPADDGDASPPPDDGPPPPDEGWDVTDIGLDVPDLADDVPDPPDEGPEVVDTGPDVPDSGPDVPDVPDAPHVLDVPDEGPDLPDAGPLVPDVPDDGPDVPDVPDEGPGVTDDGAGGTDDGPEPPDEGPPGIDDGADEGDVPALNEIVEQCLPDPPEEPLPSEIEMVLGKLSGGNFKELFDDDAIEVVQGPQGGVHLEVAVIATLPSETFAGATKITAAIEAVTVQPCCGPDQLTVGSYISNKYAMYTTGEPAEFGSGVLPVIFDANLASYYEQMDCCVRVVVTAHEPGTQTPVATGWTERRLFCVDYF